MDGTTCEETLIMCVVLEVRYEGGSSPCGWTHLHYAGVVGVGGKSSWGSDTTIVTTPCIIPRTMYKAKYARYNKIQREYENAVSERKQKDLKHLR